MEPRLPGAPVAVVFCTFWALVRLWSATPCASRRSTGACTGGLVGVHQHVGVA
ncbi:uncharacterized protein PHACADRAFT_248896 [Phanerochaete carnosa HHB-10118-sp]|uniref:Uncharacterized protein n=1 Tax=Phanerochaete carnosa (strain HHB-10118-sp) TaxID=650164 RepID=K5V7U7_PHACS|nr:uncharacterized protein PHACADRAFT_248896 [Phanerochaete carnosa HHB-10118-sp]EKM58816.1 hypothetical protein PHACADRAFT_248896 [Phanerochaete carnosa HHB-10118-sp]